MKKNNSSSFLFQKAIGKVYAVLADREKKRQYDLYGDKEPVNE